MTFCPRIFLIGQFLSWEILVDGNSLVDISLNAEPIGPVLCEVDRVKVELRTGQGELAIESLLHIGGVCMYTFASKQGERGPEMGFWVFGARAHF